MFPFSVLITPLSFFLSFSTATGVFVHDTKVDKATLTALAVPAVMASYQLGAHMVSSDLHNHAERGSLAQAVRDVKGQNPRIQPRNATDKKYVSHKNSDHGHNPFNSSTQPLFT